MLKLSILWILIISSMFSVCVGRGNSMCHSIKDGQMMLLLKVEYSLRDIKVGDIVGFTRENSEGEQDRMLKRVMAVAGDIVEIKDYELFINGASTGQLGYVESHPPLIILKNYVYVAGDSYWSFDSREYGPIHTSIIKERLVSKLPIIRLEKPGK